MTHEIPIALFARVTECARCRGSCSHAVI